MHATSSIHEQVDTAVEKRDLDRLNRLHDALTKNLGFSHYSTWPADAVMRAVEITEAALSRLGKRLPTEPKAKRKTRAPGPALDLSTLAQSDLFEDPERWPHRPYCTDDLESGVKIRGLRQALLHPYLSANPPHLRVWSLFDIDRAGAANAWEEAGLPPPAWTSVNRANGHAHSAWGLSVPVLVDGLGARDAPLRYLCAVESMMREKLQADQGFAGLITKNPSHPLWMTLRGPRMTYELSELAEYLPGIEKYRPKRNAEKIGLGRNVSLFDGLRKWSYSGIRAYWGGGLQGWNAWLSSCNNHALCMNADLFGINTLDGKEVWHIARSVAKWTWRNFSQEGFSAYQASAGAKGGKASGIARLKTNEDKRSSARLMRSSGMTIRTIADELLVSVGAVHKWCE